MYFSKTLPASTYAVEVYIFFISLHLQDSNMFDTKKNSHAHIYCKKISEWQSKSFFICKMIYKCYLSLSRNNYYSHNNNYYSHNNYYNSHNNNYYYTNYYRGVWSIKTWKKSHLHWMAGKICFCLYINIYV